MYRVQRLVDQSLIDSRPRLNLILGSWIDASKHTTQTDANAQLSIFTANGVDPNNLKIIQDEGQ